MAGVADTLRIDRVLRDRGIDACDDILAVLLAPLAPGCPLERVAVSRRAPEVRIEDEIAVRREELLLEVEAVAGGRVRSAVASSQPSIGVPSTLFHCSRSPLLSATSATRGWLMSVRRRSFVPSMFAA